MLAAQDHVRRLGARPMMWHDQLVRAGDQRWRGLVVNGLDATVRLLDVMKRDVIICD